jgi:hypothetical protein
MIKETSQFAKCKDYAEDFFSRSPKYRTKNVLEDDMCGLVIETIREERAKIAKAYAEAKGIDHDAFIDYLIN